MLFPREVLPSLLHLTPAWLKARGLKGVILDLDNTLLPYGEGTCRRPTGRGFRT